MVAAYGGPCNRASLVFVQQGMMRPPQNWHMCRTRIPACHASGPNSTHMSGPPAAIDWASPVKMGQCCNRQQSGHRRQGSSETKAGVGRMALRAVVAVVVRGAVTGVAPVTAERMVSVGVTGILASIATCMEKRASLVTTQWL